MHNVSKADADLADAGAEIVEFSPTEIFGETIPVVMKNLEAARVVVGKPS